MVYVLRGSPEGVGGAYAVRLPGARPGDQFGFSLSVGYSSQASRSFVIAGAPGRDVGGASDAGVIGWFWPGATGPTVVEPISQGSSRRRRCPRIWGTGLARCSGRPSNQRETAMDVVVGVPREDVGAVTDAGIVEQVTLIADGGGPHSTIYRQESGGPMGVPEPGDRFGSAIATSDDIDSNTLAVGVPGEDVGAVRNAGAVNLLTSEWTFPEDVHYVSRRAVTQQSARVPGNVEAGDSFGASLEGTFYCPADRDDSSGSISADFAVGAPGEDLGNVVDAGTVTLYDTGLSGDGRAAQACPSHLIRQDGLAAGHAEAGDQLGADLDSRLSTELLVAVPGEDVGAVVDAGLVDVIDIGRFAQRPAEQFVTGPRAGLRYATLP